MKLGKLNSETPKPRKLSIKGGPDRYTITLEGADITFCVRGFEIRWDVRQRMANPVVMLALMVDEVDFEDYVELEKKKITS